MFDTITKKICLLFVLILSIVYSINGCIEQENTNGNNQSILYVGLGDTEYRTIHEALNQAVNGTTILIRNGSYNEFVTINRSICLRGESRNSTFIQCKTITENTQISIITITSSHCSIENLQIILQNTSGVTSQGITITSNNNTIQNTCITGVTTGIELLTFSSFNKIRNNEIRNNHIGISCAGSTHNNISNNTIFSNNQYDIYLSGGSDQNNLSYNVINNSHFGIKIYGSMGNKIFNNCIKSNVVGVNCCCSGQDNYFYNNTLINNSKNAIDTSHNLWYDFPHGKGNFWDDYNGSDINKDGIGDTPYMINPPENYDMYPLMIPSFDIPCYKI